MIIYVFNFKTRSFIFQVGRWNGTLKTYNQKISVKNHKINTNILKMKFDVEEPFQ
jgi:hypothetical protein